MEIIELLNEKLAETFKKLDLNPLISGRNIATFQVSNRPDMGDFQSNCAMPLGKILNKSPREIAENIVLELKKSDIFMDISVAGSGFINASLADKFILDYVNKTKSDLPFDEIQTSAKFANIGDITATDEIKNHKTWENQEKQEEKKGEKKNSKKKTVIIDFGGFNIAKEPHVGHLRSTVIGESLRRIYIFCGDRVISDMHQGDWGLNMGLVICGIEVKYPNLACFQKDFDGDDVDDLNLTASDLTEIYRYANARAKEDTDFMEKVHKATKLLQDGYKPYGVLWKYFTSISIAVLNELAVNTLGAHFDLWNGESHVNELMRLMIRNLSQMGVLKQSEGAKIIEFSEEEKLPPLIMEKSDGALMYASSDMATILDRIQTYNADLLLYVVDGRQSLHFKQVFAACKKINLLNEKHRAEHCPFGTVNGKDGKPLKTRDGEFIKLGDMIEEVIDKIREKSEKNGAMDENNIKKIALACIKFADLINYRESDYIFDFNQFTTYEGKTGAYLLYAIVRINAILANCGDLEPNFKLKIEEFHLKEERDILLELVKFGTVIRNAYDKKAPNFIADYAYGLAKKFSSFYAVAPISGEPSNSYKMSKISLISAIKRHLEMSLWLLGIDTVDRM